MSYLTSYAVFMIHPIMGSIRCYNPFSFADLEEVFTLESAQNLLLHARRLWPSLDQGDFYLCTRQVSDWFDL